MLPILVYCGLAGSAIVATELQAKKAFRVLKPAATLALLPIIGLFPSHSFGWLIFTGILFSLAGDIALLSDEKGPFLAGLASFLLAHCFYIAAFYQQADWTSRAVVLGCFAAAASGALVGLLWLYIEGLRLPVIFYALAITLMITCAFATLEGPLPPQASLAAFWGAFLFYFSDASLSWRQFRHNYPHAHSVTLTLYWTGQLGIALSARWSHGVFK